MNGLFCRGCISLGSPSVWQCQGGHCGLWAGALSLGARRAGLLYLPAPGTAFLLGTRATINPVSASPRPGEGFQVGILLEGRDWASCCPFLLSQLHVSRGQGSQRRWKASVYPCHLLLTGTLAYLPLHTCTSLLAWPGWPAWCWPHGSQ